MHNFLVEIILSQIFAVSNSYLLFAAENKTFMEKAVCESAKS